MMLKEELSLSKVRSVVVCSWANHLPLEREQSASDYWETLEPQKQVVV